MLAPAILTAPARPGRPTDAEILARDVEFARVALARLPPEVRERAEADYYERYTSAPRDATTWLLAATTPAAPPRREAFLARVREDDEFSRDNIARLPAEIRASVRREYVARHSENSQQGNTWLLRLAAFAAREGRRLAEEILPDVPILNDLGEMPARAWALGADAGGLRNRLARFDFVEDEVRTFAEEICRNPAAAAGRTERQLRQRLRRARRQLVEKLAYKIGSVGEGKEEQYASIAARGLRERQLRGWVQFAKKTTVKLDDKEICLEDIRVGAAARRFAEMYTIMKGVEKAAGAAGLDWSAWTLTAPPEFHPSPANGNCSWNDETDAHGAHRHIADKWEILRARLCKHGIRLSGLRVTEPHKDGCAHWHAAIFYRTEDAKIIREEIRELWPSEAAAWERIGDDSKGSFATYMFKYLSKTLNYTDAPGAQALGHAARGADAWRSTWGVRGYQFFGVPGRKVWRSLRQQTEAPSDDADLVGLWRAARRGDAAEFIARQGGLAAALPRGERGGDRYSCKTIIDDRETRQEIVFDKVAEEPAATLAPRRKWTIVFNHEDQNQDQKNQKTAQTRGVTVIQNDPRNPKAKPPHPAASAAPEPIWRSSRQPKTEDRPNPIHFSGPPREVIEKIARMTLANPAVLLKKWADAGLILQ